MKNKWLLLLLLIFSVPAFNQVRLQKILGGNFNDGIYDLFPLSGGQNLAVGSKTNANSTLSAVVLKMDSIGNILWQKNTSESGKSLAFSKNP